ncbi:YihY/virulence factor BrkB family protein [Luteipulveratus halotolerans]|uniref:YihY/virulence factor BrkB family protein n=1 Tax=Luteipulveratus halotolerans TaxID=1631356 RepID=UPI000682F949|nr:YihY/virulence factor BrkB family protein [Luteipulveratus halotolerans]
MTLQTETAVERPVDDIPRTTAKPSWKVAVKRAIQKFSQDQCTDVAAMLTYYSMLALFPGLIAVVSLIGVFDIKPDTLIEIVAGIMDKPVTDSTFETPRTILNNFSSQSGAGLALLVGVLGALWSASGYVGGFSRALNRIYDIGEGRPFIKLRPWLYLITAVEVLLIVLVLVAMVFSGSVANEVGKKIGLGQQAVDVWNIAKWPFVCLIVILVICLLYWATPNVRKPRRIFLSWGAAIGFLVWVLASAAFGIYVTMTGGSSYNKTYGAFAGAVMFLLWLWITNLALLFGAELDAELERTRQLKSGLPAEELILLPARDDTGLQKNAEKYDETVHQAHELRLRSDADHEKAAEGLVPALAVRRSNERTASAMTASTDGPTRPATRHVDGTPEGYGAPSRATQLREDSRTQPYDAAREREIVRIDREDRRAAALVEAGRNRKVRDRLEAQEAKAAQARKEAERKAKEAREARESQVTREERWAEVDRVRAQFAPRDSVARDEVSAERQARRATYDAEQAQKAANPPAPKPPKPKKSPMPSALRTQVEQERAERRTSWYQARRPQNVGPSGATSVEIVDDERVEDEPQFRRDRRARS